MTSASPQGFEEWFAGLIASAEEPAEMEGRTLATMRPDVRAYLETVFQVHGPMTSDELEQALAADRGRLEALRLQACHQLLPNVLQDAAAWGVADLEVRVSANHERDDERLVMDIRHPSWASPHRYGDDGFDSAGPALGRDADTLAWLAEGIQEACLLAPRPKPAQFWPLCPHHGAGVHPRVLAAEAVWWCTAGAGRWETSESGHVLGKIGEQSVR